MVIGSQLAMPILVLNMGGEMIYILHQRLQAQNVPEEKSRKVLEDVVRTMYTPMFLEELFKPQEVYSNSSTKQIFEKLAHSSIMRLNKTSMDKLYDLMTMGVKHQVLSCKSPHQYLQVTLNHLDTVMDMIKSESVNNLVQIAIAKSIQIYSQLSNGNLLLLEQVLYQFLQGKKIKVSLFLQQQLQTVNGVLVINNKGSLPFGTREPGNITYFDKGQPVRVDQFPTELSGKCYECDEVLDPTSRLGKNMYLASSVRDAQAKVIPTQSAIDASKALAEHQHHHHHKGPKSLQNFHIADSKSSSPAPKGQSSAESSMPKTTPGKSSAKEELNLLSDLLGIGSSSSPAKSPGDKGGAGAEAKPFMINLFPNQNFNSKQGDDDDASGSADAKDGGNFIILDIDGAAGAKTLSAYMDSLDLKDSMGGATADSKANDDDDEDLLALMDSAK